MRNDKTDTDWLALAGQVCVVTGAGSGIGAATAEELARLGAAVAVLDRDGDAAERTAHLIGSNGGTAIAITADVADEASVKAAARAVEAQLGPCRTLVNNAAVRHRQRLVEVGLEDWHRVLGVNLTGALLCAQTFASQMIKAGQGGSLIHVASLVGHHPQIDGGPYSVSKAAMLMMSRVLALELAEHRIRSNTVSPGFFRTPATEASYRDPEIAAARTRLIPAARIGMPQDMGNVISFLASERSSYINAQDLTVDGGVGSTLMGKVPVATFKRPA
jgi:NAD(P)-dependent dehydrogenase (short-subunit alcohol dehydrogenase family)